MFQCWSIISFYNIQRRKRDGSKWALIPPKKWTFLWRAKIFLKCKMNHFFPTSMGFPNSHIFPFFIGLGLGVMVQAAISFLWVSSEVTCRRMSPWALKGCRRNEQKEQIPHDSFLLPPNFLFCHFQTNKVLESQCMSHFLISFFRDLDWCTVHCCFNCRRGIIG